MAADLWSVTSWNELSREALAAEEWNLMHPLEEPRTPYVTAEDAATPPARWSRSATTCGPCRRRSRGGCRSASTPSAPTGSASPTRVPAARRFFKIDAESVVCQALTALAEEGRIGRDAVQKALDHYRIDDPTAVSGVKQEGGDA